MSSTAHLLLGEKLLGFQDPMGVFTVMIVWITANSVYLLFQPFDPFPYILLNLALSLLAAIQAPIILMSQNRQTERDRHQSVPGRQRSMLRAQSRQPELELVDDIGQ